MAAGLLVLGVTEITSRVGRTGGLFLLEAFLSDQPDSRQEIVFADLRNKSTEELREMVRQEVEMLKEVEIQEKPSERLQGKAFPSDDLAGARRENSG